MPWLPLRATSPIIQPATDDREVDYVAPAAVRSDATLSVRMATIDCPTVDRTFFISASTKWQRPGIRRRGPSSCQGTLRRSPGVPDMLSGLWWFRFISIPVSGSSLSSWSLFVTFFLVLYEPLLSSLCLFYIHFFRGFVQCVHNLLYSFFWLIDHCLIVGKTYGIHSCPN